MQTSRDRESTQSTKARDKHVPGTQVSFSLGPRHELRSHSAKARDKHVPGTQVSVSQGPEQACPKDSGINFIPRNLD